MNGPPDDERGLIEPEEAVDDSPSARRRRGLGAALVSGTSSEFLGRKPLPRAVRERPVVFVLGPKGVGKTSVAHRLLGQDARFLSEKALAEAVTRRVRDRVWQTELVSARGLILEGPCYLPQRPAVGRALRELLGDRVRAGLSSVIIEPEDGCPIRPLIEAVPVDHRATILLRFPVGRGRRRFAVRVCTELRIDASLARQAADLDPWSYAAVRAHLLALSKQR